MLQPQVSAVEPVNFVADEHPPLSLRVIASPGLESLVAGLPLQRRRLRARVRALLIEGLRMGLETGFLQFSTFSN